MAEKKSKLTVRDLAIFAALGVIMFILKFAMQSLPNIHLVGVLTVTYTFVFRERALIPIYLYVFLDGLFGGFGLWWIPYLYIWAVLWLFVMLLPKKLPTPAKNILGPLLCGFHGFLFGTLYAPAQALIFGLSFRQMCAWILAGLPFDAIQGVSNLIMGLLIYPLTEFLTVLYNKNRPE